MKKIIFGIVIVIAVLVGVIALRARTSELRHVVLISIDTCRADYFSSYGYPRPTTPNIDVVGEQATRFETVVSPVPITLPAHSSILTGKVPPAHGVHHNFGYQLANSNRTLAEILSAEGFGTDAIISTFVLHSQFGISQGFDSYYDTFSAEHQNDHGLERKGGETTLRALDWINKNKDKKSFLFLHYYDPHYDYAPPEPFASEWADDLYAGEIAFTDYCVGQVIDRLKELDMYDSTLLIVTGDHGEMLGEHGENTHTYFIYESAIKVPMIIKLPGQRTGITVSEPVGLVDIFPTVCSLLGIDAPSGTQGVDLSAFLRGNIPDNYERHLYSESVAPTRFSASSLMAISDGRWKYIQAPRAELYDVIADPGEQTNLLEKEPHRVRILEDKLREILEQSVSKDPDSRMELDRESIKRLESLGYVAGKEEGEIVFDDTKGDPKDFVHLIELMRTVKHLTEDKEFAKARTLLESEASQSPDCVEIFLKLGTLGLQQSDYDCAVKNFRRVYQLDPDSIPTGTYNNLAWIQATRPLLPSRNVGEALEYAKRNAEQTKYKDPHIMDTLAVAYAAAGDFTQAIEMAKIAQDRASAASDDQLAWRIAQRKTLFEQSKPYIEE